MPSLDSSPVARSSSNRSKRTRDTSWIIGALRRNSSNPQRPPMVGAPTVMQNRAMHRHAAAITCQRHEPPTPALGPGTLVRRPVLLYSSTCRFCRWAARVVAALDRRERLALLPLATEEAAYLLATVPQSKRTESWWLVLHDGSAVAGKDGGALVLLAEIPLTSWIASALVWTGLSPLVHRLEALIARHRGAMSRVVPDGPAPSRFP